MTDIYNYATGAHSVLVHVKDVGRFFVFIVGGLVAIIVGSFMIRGTMHMWDNPDDHADKEKDKNK